jgi:hypothetical protein
MCPRGSNVEMTLQTYSKNSSKLHQTSDYCLEMHFLRSFLLVPSGLSKDICKRTENGVTEIMELLGKINSFFSLSTIRLVSLK